ncbi:MAG: AAA family ATPase, partial [Rhizobacter sp.]
MAAIHSNSLQPPGRIVVLNGPSSSGKTSLARAMQPQLPEPHQHLQLDAFRAMEPAGYWEGWERRDPAAVALKLAALCRAMNAALIEYSRHGQHVIFDMALTNRDAWRYLL